LTAQPRNLELASIDFSPHQLQILPSQKKSQKMPEVAAPVVTQRIVPGAPPPAPASKSQRKKRKAAAKDSPAEERQETPEVTENHGKEASGGNFASVAASENGALETGQATPLLEDDLLLKLSPIVDLIHKRLKATTKKIVRIFAFHADIGCIRVHLASTEPDNRLCCDRP
jgi:hypothetical protein